MIIFFFILFGVTIAGYSVTLSLLKKYQAAYKKERFLHTQTLLECRGLYEDMNRHLKRSGLGELPIPELLERETIKRLNNETELHISSAFGITTKLQN